MVDSKPTRNAKYLGNAQLSSVSSPKNHPLDSPKTLNFEHSGTLWWVRANLASPTSRHQHVSDLLECRKDYLLSFVVPFGCELLALAPLFFFRRSLRFAGGVPCCSFLECVFDLRSHVRPSSREAVAQPVARRRVRKRRIRSAAVTGILAFVLMLTVTARFGSLPRPVS